MKKNLILLFIISIFLTNLFNKENKPINKPAKSKLNKKNILKIFLNTSLFSQVGSTIYLYWKGLKNGYFTFYKFNNLLNENDGNNELNNKFTNLTNSLKNHNIKTPETSSGKFLTKWNKSGFLSNLHLADDIAKGIIMHSITTTLFVIANCLNTLNNLNNENNTASAEDEIIIN